MKNDDFPQFSPCCPKLRCSEPRFSITTPLTCVAFVTVPAVVQISMKFSNTFQQISGLENFHGILTGAKRREWMGMGVAGMIITSDCGSFPKIPYV